MSTQEIRQAIKRLDINDKAPFLVISWKVGRENFSASVRLHETMLAELRSICSETLNRIDDLEARDYDADARLDLGEEAMYVSPDKINTLSPIYEVLASIDDLDELGARAAAVHKIAWYAICFGQADNVTLFVRKRLEQVNGESRLIGLAGDALRPSTRAVMIFDRHVDLIVRPEGIVVLNERAFEGLVRSPDDITAELVRNVDAVAAAVPFDADTLVSLKARGIKRPMIRRRVQSIVDRGHLRGVRIADVQKKLKQQGFNPKLFIAGQKLKFDMQHALLVLKFLDEGTWLGVFSGTLYASDGKSPVEHGATD